MPALADLLAELVAAGDDASRSSGAASPAGRSWSGPRRPRGRPGRPGAAEGGDGRAVWPSVEGGAVGVGGQGAVQGAAGDRRRRAVLRGDRAARRRRRTRGRGRPGVRPGRAGRGRPGRGPSRAGDRATSVEASRRSVIRRNGGSGVRGPESHGDWWDWPVISARPASCRHRSRASWRSAAHAFASSALPVASARAMRRSRASWRRALAGGRDLSGSRCFIPS